MTPPVTDVAGADCTVAGHDVFMSGSSPLLESYGPTRLPVPLRPYPELVELIIELPPERQRAVAVWAATAAAREAGFDDDPEVLEALESAAPGSVTPVLDARRAELDRLSTTLEQREIDKASFGSVEVFRLWQQARALTAVRYLASTDQQSAVLAAVGGLVGAWGCARLSREDDARDRLSEGIAALATLLRGEQEGNPDEQPRLPTPVTRQEWTAAIALDQDRELRGDFLDAP